jgi:predicted permease
MRFPSQDLRYGVRMLRKNIGSTSIIVLSLAIGIGANSAIFSVVDALLLRPLPYPEPERLAAVWLHSPGIGIFRDWPSPGQYVDIQNENHSLDRIALAQSRSLTLTGREKPERVDVMRTQSSLLGMLGGRAHLGRLLLPEDDKPGRTPVTILTDRVWKRLFSSDPTIVGKSILLNGNPYTVAGVLGPEFLLNNEVMPSEGPMDKVDVILPLPLGPDAAQRRGDENYNIMVRLKPGVSVQQAQADINMIANRIRVKDKRDRTFGMHIIGLDQQVVGDVRRALLVLLASVTLVLLIACANVANLLLTRASGRAKEMAIRTALGADWRRIVRQLLTESVLLALIGGAAGLALAKWSLYLVRTMNPGNIPRFEDIGINGTVLAFTFAISLATGILFGLAPAWRAIQVDLTASLKTGGRRGQGDAGLRVSRHRLRGLLVVAELALSLILLIGAGLLIRSFGRLQHVPPGFNTDRVLSMQVAATGPQYRQNKPVVQFYQEIESRIARLPGVLAAGAVSVLPLGGSIGWGQINVEDYAPQPGQELQVDIRIASTDYFRTMEIPLMQGRFFDSHDTAAAKPVAIIDEKFARRFWPHANPVGKHVWFDDPKKAMTIAGVVGVVKQEGLDAEGKIAVYFPHQQQTSNGMFLVARTSSSDPASLANAIVREIHAVDANVAVYQIRTMEDRLAQSLARRRFSSTMLGAFALFALLLASVGVYGVMSYLVAQSRHDVGLRVAIGARPADIIGLVVRQGMGLAAAGIIAGLAGATALTRLLSGLLFGIRATDAVTFVSVAALLAATAFFATVIPAFRATRVDPIVALREE